MIRTLNNYLGVDILLRKVYNYLGKYPTPLNLNYMWGFGSLSGVFLVVQLITGILLTFHYIPHIDYAFSSVEHIMRDVNNGWLLRYMHSNGASMFFLVIYLHILKALYYGSYKKPRHLVWYSGVIIYILLIATAFLGYVLPWGQMSYWAATVITNILTVVPYIGKDIVYWVWGGYAINNATLQRFFSLHYLLPFVIVILSIYHLYALHKIGSGNELGVRTDENEKIPFQPYFVIKDIFGACIFFLIYISFLFFLPEKLGHSDNYIMANPLVTPSHIVPEWYFLPFYGILRSILDKTYGIVLTAISMFVLLLLPTLDKHEIRSKSFDTFNRYYFWFFILNFFFLGYLGSETPVSPYIELGVIGTHIHLLYFFLFIVMNNYMNYLFVANSYRGVRRQSNKMNNKMSVFMRYIIGTIITVVIYTIMSLFVYYLIPYSDAHYTNAMYMFFLCLFVAILTDYLIVYYTYRDYRSNLGSYLKYLYNDTIMVRRGKAGIIICILISVMVYILFILSVWYLSTHHYHVPKYEAKQVHCIYLLFYSMFIAILMDYLIVFYYYRDERTNFENYWRYLFNDAYRLIDEKTAVVGSIAALYIIEILLVRHYTQNHIWDIEYQHVLYAALLSLVVAILASYFVDLFDDGRCNDLVGLIYSTIGTILGLCFIFYFPFLMNTFRIIYGEEFNYNMCIDYVHLLDDKRYLYLIDITKLNLFLESLTPEMIEIIKKYEPEVLHVLTKLAKLPQMHCPEGHSHKFAILNLDEFSMLKNHVEFLSEKGIITSHFTSIIRVAKDN